MKNQVNSKLITTDNTKCIGWGFSYCIYCNHQPKTPNKIFKLIVVFLITAYFHTFCRFIFPKPNLFSDNVLRKINNLVFKHSSKILVILLNKDACLNWMYNTGIVTVKDRYNNIFFWHVEEIIVETFALNVLKWF